MMATRGGMDYSRGSGGRSSSVVAARFLGIARALVAARARILRRSCHLLLGIATTFGPELQTLIMYAIDYNCMHYLSGSTACEMMYGLKRSKVVGGAHARRIEPSQSGDNAQRGDHVANVHYQRKVAELNIFDKTLSAVLAALLPYCKERCDRLYKQWTEQSNDGSPSYHLPIDTRMNRSSAYIDSMKKFVQLYPYFHMVHEGSIFLYQFAYLMGFSSYWSVSLHAMRVILRRMTVADMQQQQQQKHMLATRNHQNVLEGRVLPSQQSTQTAPLQTHGNSFDSAKSALQTSITIPRLFRGAVLCSIAYTLLSGWYSHFQRELQLRRRRWIAGNEDNSTSRRQEVGMDEGDPRRITKLPIPPPPMPPNLIEEIDHNVDKWSCPICKEPRINPTASTSGYVYCYKCLVSHIRNVGEYCPMTGMPCWEDRVVRLFEPTASRRVVHGEVNRASRQ